MPWSYDPENLGKDTPEQMKNSVRFLVGDTDTSDQQVDDDEILFALDQTSDNIYFAGSMIAESIQAKFARMATSEVDRTLRVRYSDLQEHYRNLAQRLKERASNWGSGIMASAGGINTLQMQIVRSNPLRPLASYRGEFDYPKGRYRDDSGY